MSERQRFRIVRQAEETPLGPAFEAVPDGEPDVRVTLWPGPEPGPLPGHPCLATVRSSGHLEGRPHWVESRPRGILWSDLGTALGDREVARLALHLMAGLQALHERGFTYGGLDASRVVVGLDGQPVLIGVGLGVGSVDNDLVDLRALVTSVSGIALLEPSIEAMTQTLRRVRDEAPLGERTLPEMIRARFVPDPMTLGTVEITRDAWGVDEVKVDLGPDETNRGLLERWTSRDTDTSAGEHTGTAAGEKGVERRRTALLSRLASGPFREAGRFTKAEGQAVPEILQALQDEPFEPLPVPDGVPVGPPVVGITDLAEVTLTSRPKEMRLLLSERTLGFERTVPRLEYERTVTSARVPEDSHLTDGGRTPVPSDELTAREITVTATAVAPSGVSIWVLALAVTGALLVGAALGLVLAP